MTWMSNEKYDEDKIKKIINEYNQLDPSIVERNYFSDKFGDKYYHVNDAKIIGYIRTIRSKSNE